MKERFSCSLHEPIPHIVFAAAVVEAKHVAIGKLKVHRQVPASHSRATRAR